MKTCTTCGRQYDPKDIRGTHPFRHPVSGALIDSTKESSEPASRDLPTDPVLRLVLIEKGVIGTEDLRRVEEQLAASGMAVSGERVEQRDRGDVSDDASDELPESYERDHRGPSVRMTGYPRL